MEEYIGIIIKGGYISIGGIMLILILWHIVKDVISSNDKTPGEPD